ncbi:D-alanyl-D-alanine dipeptidase/carboxypeptidase [Acetitomaculum ruminis DSM 5522]|uniref:D-alanyl-D-alanine dipeptidase/carboxypeptidase n=1 Tax=Acetitomaculum ruminis DSM 5522 TaxID=1120918 RepID=A0A1I0ZWA9_9FIRM|nr:M15 family metallopeptidase [Acetitomaculum ruminis]SFB28720.1 D-alanyl-D-alanine dipeptidase/carboxypeptidase [Acetitomaculum ruminis DSM 5522]
MIREIILENKDIYKGNLILVNEYYPLKKFEINDLKPLEDSDIYLKNDVVDILEKIIKKISAKGKIVYVSGYRSLEEQKNIWNDSIRESGEEFTRKYVAIPGCSEHHTGLAIDLGLKKEEIDFICPDFPYDGICEEFRKLACDYGFIERYQKEKEEITKISKEPWHFRYLGYPHSKIIKEKGFCLEEYIDFIKEYDNEKKYIFKNSKEETFEIYFLPAKKDKTLLQIPEGLNYELSGNNVDGFIITLWGRENA